jgi:hypothetical protein
MSFAPRDEAPPDVHTAAEPTLGLHEPHGLAVVLEIADVPLVVVDLLVAVGADQEAVDDLIGGPGLRELEGDVPFRDEGPDLALEAAARPLRIENGQRRAVRANVVVGEDLAAHDVGDGHEQLGAPAPGAIERARRRIPAHSPVARTLAMERLRLAALLDDEIGDDAGADAPARRPESSSGGPRKAPSPRKSGMRRGGGAGNRTYPVGRPSDASGPADRVISRVACDLGFGRKGPQEDPDGLAACDGRATLDRR